MSIRRTLAAVLSVGTLFLATACAGDDLDSSSSSSGDDTGTPSATTSASTSESATTTTSAGGPITLAGQAFPEAALVASMYEQILDSAGYDVTVKLVDSRDGYMADFPGGVDIVPEYVGGIVNFLNSKANGDNATPFDAGDGAQLVQQGQQLLDAAGITLLDQSAATDTNAFMVTKKYSDANGVTKLSDLSGKSVTLAAAPDCEGRLDCEGGLKDQYGIDITKVLPLGYATDQTYQSVIKGESELGETSTTDGTLESQGLVVLDDDKQIQPAQNLVPAVSTEFLTAHPDVADLLNPLMAALTTENLTDLNSKVAVDRAKPEDVAKQFLTDNGLL
jgi:osmoprotectant transport system substrate-binding protein